MMILIDTSRMPPSYDAFHFNRAIDQQGPILCTGPSLHRTGEVAMDSLSENEKLLILLVAFVFVLLTLLLTTCLVYPQCYLHRRFIKSKMLKKKKEPAFSVVYPSLASNHESQHFHLSIVPVYGTQPESRSLASSPVKHPSCESNQYENLTQLAEKTRIRYSSLKPDNLKALPLFPKVKAQLYYEIVDESTFSLHITIDQVYDLKLKEYLCEPSCYVTITLVGYRALRKSIISKGRFIYVAAWLPLARTFSIFTLAFNSP